MKNKNYIFYAISIIISIYLFIVCLSNCTYNIYGDSVVYMKWLLSLSSGDYFIQNWNALLGSGEHLRLTTEGGYIFFLWFASLINRELPFFISAFFISGFIILLTALVILLEKPRKRAIFTGLITLILIFSYYNITEELMMLNACMRDGSAHFFGILGVLLSCIGVKKNYSKTYILTGFLFIGIGAWCRVPNILFVVPAATYVLVNIKKTQFKKLIFIALTMLFGLIIGLLPLLSQNIFEGKSFYNPGQASTLISEQKPLDEERINVITPTVAHVYSRYAYQEKFEGTKKGLSFKNFPIISKAIYLNLFVYLGRINFYLLSLIIILSIILNYKLALTMLSGFLSFYLFYSCYDKVITRYIIICFIMLFPLIAIVISEFLFMMLNSRLFKKRPKLSYLFLLVIVLILLVFQTNKYNLGKAPLMESRSYFTKNKKDLEQLKLTKNDYFTCLDKSYRIWTQYFYGAKSFRWVWSVSPHFSVLPNNMQQLQKVKDAIDCGNRIFFFEVQRGKYPYKYWSKLDINTHYDLTEKLRIELATPAKEDIVIYQLKPKSTKKKIIEINASKGKTNLFIWTADASNVVPTNQTVIISSKTSAITNELYLGLNIYSLPNNFLQNDNFLTLDSKTNLPAIVDASLFSTNLTYDLRKYENISGVTRTFVKSTPIWMYNRYSWAREIKPPKAMYRKPKIALGNSVRFDLYNGQNSNLCLTLNISMSTQIKTKYIRKLLINNINFKCNGKDIIHDVKLIKRTFNHSERNIYADLNITNLTGNTNYIIDADFQHCSEKLPIFLNSITITCE